MPINRIYTVVQGGGGSILANAVIKEKSTFEMIMVCNGEAA